MSCDVQTTSFSLPLIHNNEKLKETGSNNVDNTTSTTSFSKTCFHGLNALSGVGILSIPFALATGGWLSLILFFAIAAMTFYTGLLIQKCMEIDSEIRTYPDIGFRAFGNRGRLLVSVLLNLELYLVATSFLLVEGDNLQNLFPDVGFEIAGLKLDGKQMFTIVAAVIVLPSVWLDNLSVLSYISASGVLASALVLGSVFWVGAFDGIGFNQKGIPVNWKGIPTSVSLYAFSYCGHAVFPTLYSSMKNKRQFPQVMIICFVLCTITYASMAVFGYLMFGSEVQSQITLDLPIQKLSSRIAIYTTLVNPIAKYGLVITPIISAIKRRFQGIHIMRFFSIYVGTTLVISTLFVALLFPFFGYLMALVGAFLSSTVSIILPCLCYMKISGNYRRLSFEMVAMAGVIVLGVVIVVTGTYTSVFELLGHM